MMRELRAILGFLLGACLVIVGLMYFWPWGPGKPRAPWTGPLPLFDTQTKQPWGPGKPRVPWTGPLPLFDTQTKQVSPSVTEHPDLDYWRQHRWMGKLPANKNASLRHQSYLYHSYLDNINYLCRNKLRMGKVGDGGWEVCDDPEYRPVKPCTIYSFGINNDFSFDDEVNKLYGCDVFAFDPSMNMDSHQRSAGVYFYNVGLGGEAGKVPPFSEALALEEGWRMESLTDIKAMLQHTNKTIDILKMDIESSEWLVLEHMLSKGELDHIRQLYVEYHIVDFWDQLPQMYAVLKQIENLGFHRFYSHLNPECDILTDVYPIVRTACYEVYSVNTHLARTQNTTSL